jgi:hypothetical protein
VRTTAETLEMALNRRIKTLPMQMLSRIKQDGYPLTFDDKSPIPIVDPRHLLDLSPLLLGPWLAAQLLEPPIESDSTFYVLLKYRSTCSAANDFEIRLNPIIRPPQRAAVLAPPTTHLQV